MRQYLRHVLRGCGYDRPLLNRYVLLRWLTMVPSFGFTFWILLLSLNLAYPGEGGPVTGLPDWAVAPAIIGIVTPFIAAGIWLTYVILAIAYWSSGHLTRQQAIEMMKYTEDPNFWLVDPAADPLLEGGPVPRESVAARARIRVWPERYVACLTSGVGLVMLLFWRVLPGLYARQYGSWVDPDGSIAARTIVFLAVTFALLWSWGRLWRRLGLLPEAEATRFPMPPR